MKPTTTSLFHESPLRLLTRPWKKYRDGTLFYGVSKAGNRRTPLTTKQGNKTLYKGTRSSGIGRHTRYGGYTINWAKVRTFRTPASLNMDLKPLVSHNLPELKQTFEGFPKGALDSDLYFKRLREYVNKGKVSSEASNIDCYTEKV
ncbi:LAMI_0H10946g1_1 [Lachancea mirantina]|uniref:LAMI_0H10946g1_1 n=1 Tax=Lachancea mirantina TaxID=1230905 RepID=A0A1G4KH86_9SACH|nr:LAMI_0H10946g1_1 [Lachancea mirantina]